MIFVVTAALMRLCDHKTLVGTFGSEAILRGLALDGIRRRASISSVSPTGAIVRCLRTTELIKHGWFGAESSVERSTTGRKGPTCWTTGWTQPQVAGHARTRRTVFSTLPR